MCNVHTYVYLALRVSAVLLSAPQLRHASKLSDAVRCALLPSADMIVSLSMEFGVPVTFADLACECV